MKPSQFAMSMAAKRAKLRNRAVGADKKRVSLNFIDVLQAMDRLHKRISDLEDENIYLKDLLENINNGNSR